MGERGVGERGNGQGVRGVEWKPHLQKWSIIFCSGQAQLVSNIDSSQVGPCSSEGSLHLHVAVADGIHQSCVAGPIHCIQLHSLHPHPLSLGQVLVSQETEVQAGCYNEIKAAREMCT